ncbi:MAG: efflux RND transporter periplasmic adaptor subunit [bacterium]|nr:efflux RND transporter periplasmic adaptor subunit [bacterium]
MKTTNRLTLLGTFLAAHLVLGALLLAGCGPEVHHDEHEEAEHADEVSTISLSPEAVQSAGIVLEPVGRRAVEPTIEATGRLGYDEQRMAIATARIGGRIAQVVADYGATVSAGQVLAWIDSPALGAAQAKYRQALARSRVQEAEVERARILLEGEAISRAELLRREGERQTARAELESATQTLHLLGLSSRDIEKLSAASARPTTTYPVRAPIAGKVTERTASTGQIVDPDTRLFVVAELDELWLMLQLFEKDLPAVSEGSAVSLECESHPEHRFGGRIDFVADVVDPHSRTIAARAVIDNTEGKLKPGMFVYAEIAARGGADTGAQQPMAANALTVPLSALARMDERNYVFVSEGEGAFERREVRLGRRWSEWAEVLEGVEEGEIVAVAGAFALKSELLKGGLEGHDH